MCVDDKSSPRFIRPYADSSGSVIGTEKYPEGVVLDVDQIHQILSDDTSEYCKRQGHAVSMAATTFKTGADALQQALYAKHTDSAAVERSQRINGSKEVFSLHFNVLCRKFILEIT